MLVKNYKNCVDITYDENYSYPEYAKPETHTDMWESNKKYEPTIRGLYEWASDNGALDSELYIGDGNGVGSIASIKSDWSATGISALEYLVLDHNGNMHRRFTAIDPWEQEFD